MAIPDTSGTCLHRDNVLRGLAQDANKLQIFQFAGRINIQSIEITSTRKAAGSRAAAD
jgi:hypothetical protein